MEINRRDFLKFIPQYLACSIRSFTNEYLMPLDIKIAGEDVPAPENNGPRIARLDQDGCLAWQGGNCQFCYLACPWRNQAITMVDQKPWIHASFCDGCAKCLTACQTVNDHPSIQIVFAEESGGKICLEKAAAANPWIDSFTKP